MKLKDKIKEIRKRLHLTQEQFAEGLAIETSYIGRIETGKRIPGRQIIEKICSAYSIDPREFFETEKKAVIKKKEPLMAELEKLPADKKNLWIKCITTDRDMDTEGIREILKHIEKEKLWSKTRKKKRKSA